MRWRNAHRLVAGPRPHEQAARLEVVEERGVATAMPMACTASGSKVRPTMAAPCSTARSPAGSPSSRAPSRARASSGRPASSRSRRGPPPALHHLERTGLPQEPHELVEQQRVAAGRPQDLLLGGRGQRARVAGRSAARVRWSSSALAPSSSGSEAEAAAGAALALGHERRAAARAARRGPTTTSRRARAPAVGPEPLERVEHARVGEVGVVDDDDERLDARPPPPSTTPGRGAQLLGQAAAGGARVDARRARQRPRGPSSCSVRWAR